MQISKFKIIGLVLILLIAVFFLGKKQAFAATVQTSGGVTWVDPMLYAKPSFVSIAEPDENAVTNKYYIDMSSGSDSNSCTSSSPCASLGGLAGKNLPGLRGGPAYIYMRGSGQFWLFNDTLYGSAGSEVVIKPWGNATATFNDSGTTEGTVHDIIVDGGPTLSIKFVLSAANAIVHIESSNTTIYRTEAYETGTNALGGMFAPCGHAAPANCKNTQFINNEIHDFDKNSTAQIAAIYYGSGAVGNGAGYTNALIQNNLFYNSGGEVLEINPRANSTNIEISGNVFRHAGYRTCGTSWYCRPAITIANTGGSNTGVVIKNNIISDTASACIWDKGSPSASPALIYNNTCFDYNKQSDPNSNYLGAVNNDSNGGFFTAAVIQNNIFYAPNGTRSLGAGETNSSNSNNICSTASACGTAGQAYSATTTLLSTTTNTANFLQIGSGSNAVDNGATISTVTNDIFGTTRPQGSAYDIGADEFVSGSTPAPTVSISANPTTISSGSSSTLTWSSTNATSCTASGAWSGSENTSGSTSVSPTTTSTYTLTCTGTGGSGNNSATVTVNSATPVVGDINLDHIVNSIDYSILNAHWFTNYQPADLNNDGIVNAIDYSMLNANWFKTW